MARLPKQVRWLFWEADFPGLDTERHADYVLARVLEQGRMRDVRWLIATYGMERIRRFFETVGHPEISDRTLAFWRAVLDAKEDKWASPPTWRRRSSRRWPG